MSLSGRSRELSRPAPVTFLSDFGLGDGFVGEVHLIIEAVAPGARVVDLTHQVPAYDVAAGSRALERAAPWLSPVVLALVDPGGGRGRRPVAVEALGEHGRSVVLVGPDNGLLHPAGRAVGAWGRAVVLDDPRWQTPAAPGSRIRGSTFDGRDLFAPVAAHLSAGVSIDEVGSPIDPAGLVRLPDEIAVADAAGSLVARVRWIDRFGNVELNVAAAALGPAPDPTGARSAAAAPTGPGPAIRVAVASGAGPALVATVVGSYAQIATGCLGLVVDSEGWLSLAMDRASAAAALGVGEGAVVTLAVVPPEVDERGGG